MSTEEPSSKSAWIPNAGAQEAALKSNADILFYGGAAGGGKTDLLIGAAFMQHRRSILFRREYAQLTGIIDRTMELFSEQGKFNKSQMVWTLDDGRTVEFGAVQHLGDERKYQGRAHDLKAFDELAHFSEMQFRTLCGWLRNTDQSQRCRIIATGNPPMSSDGEWVIRFFAPWLDKSHAHRALPGELRWYTMLDGKEVELENGEEIFHRGETIKPKSRTFIPARVDDNEFYLKTGYKSVLQGLPEPMRSQMLFGDFSIGLREDAFQLIPRDWLEKARKRFTQGKRPDAPLSCVGVDVARGGDDRTVITLRWNNWFEQLKPYPGLLTPDGDIVAQLVLAARGASGCKVNIDVIGVGASAFDCLRRLIGGKAVPLNSSSASDGRDRSGQLSFVNRRAEWWWTLREALDPVSENVLALPDDQELMSDLMAPRYEQTVRGIQIESKEDIKKRIGRSPDRGDSLVYALAELRVPGEGYLKFYEERRWETSD